MFKVNKSAVPQRRRGGLLSHIMLQKDDVPGARLSVTWVEVESGASQKPHKHPPEQIYVVIQGEGLISVGDETAAVQEGDVIHIPPDVVHSIENTGAGTLVYISASAPSFDFGALYDKGELKQE